jgi:hypothetical protein
MAGEEGTMGKRLGLLGAVVAVMALVVGAVSPALGSSSHGSASTSSGQADKQQTIRLIAVFTEFDPNIDLGAPGFSLGDDAEAAPGRADFPAEELTAQFASGD